MGCLLAALEHIGAGRSLEDLKTWEYHTDPPDLEAELRAAWS